MRNSGAKGASYFAEIRSCGPEGRNQRPEAKRADADYTNYANSIRFGFDIHGGRVGWSFDQGLGFAQKDSIDNPVMPVACNIPIPNSQLPGEFVGHDFPNRHKFCQGLFNLF